MQFSANPTDDKPRSYRARRFVWKPCVVTDLLFGRSRDKSDLRLVTSMITRNLTSCYMAEEGRGNFANSNICEYGASISRDYFEFEEKNLGLYSF